MNISSDFYFIPQLNYSFNETNITVINESIYNLNGNLSSTPFENNVNLISNFFIQFSIKIVDFCINFLNKNDVVIGLIIGLIIGSPWILFKAEKFIRNLLSLPILSMELESRQVFCKDGFILFHGISLRNKMWFTNKIPVAFCVAPTMLNWGSVCNHIGTMWDNNPNFINNTIKDFRNKYYRCIVEQTQDDLKRKLDIYRGTGKTVYVIMEEVYIEDDSIPLNKSSKIGIFFLNSRNLMPRLKIGWSQTLQIISEDFGLIDAIKVKIPDNLKEKEAIDISLLRKKDRDKCLLDVGVPIRWPLRIEINRKIS